MSQPQERELPAATPPVPPDPDAAGHAPDGAPEALSLPERLAALADGAGSAVGVDEVLRLGRRYLGVDVAFVGRVEDGHRHLRAVSAGNPELEALAGHADPLEGSHCELVLAGSIDRVIPDALAVPAMVGVRATHDYGVRAFVGVPITLPDGEVYGTLCGFSHAPRPDLDERSGSVLSFLAALVAIQVDVEHAGGRSRREIRRYIERAIADGQPTMVFQPIVDLSDGFVSGYEALARFAALPAMPPNQWFEAAGRVDLGERLEALAIAKAFERVAALPAGSRMSVNVSAGYLASEEVQRVLTSFDLSRVVIELTEYERDVDMDAVAGSLDALRGRGAKIALDDVGSGYSGLERVVRIGPDRIKLDRTLVAGLDGQPAQQAMVAATVSYAHRVGAEIVAEGIETPAELAVLRELEVDLGQGYLLARPAESLLPGSRIDWLAGHDRAA